MCCGTRTSENNLLLSRISKSNNNFRSSGLEDLGNIFTGSAKKTFRTFNCRNIDSKINKNKNGQNQKPWFDQDCKFARQKYRKSKKRIISSSSQALLFFKKNLHLKISF
jgi:hypothetical protein